MLVSCVYVHVTPEHREDFLRATFENAENTVQEPGALRFDVIQQADDPDRFLLYEVYHGQAAADAHKATAHYARWRDTVAPWMAEPRFSVKHAALFPQDPRQWATRR